MAAERLSMRKIKEVLRLRAAGHSARSIDDCALDNTKHGSAREEVSHASFLIRGSALGEQGTFERGGISLQPVCYPSVIHVAERKEQFLDFLHERLPQQQRDPITGTGPFPPEPI